MRNRLQQLLFRFGQWMQGRHGADKLSLHLIWLSLGIWFVSLFTLRLPLFILYIAVIVFSLFRTFSKNNTQRFKELNAYENFLKKIKGFFSLQKKKWNDRKTHKYFKCKCGAVLRVPKGHKKILVTCPKCHAQSEHKT